MGLTAKEFIEIWMASTTKKEVAEKTFMKMKSIEARARLYRLHGINIKKLDDETREEYNGD